VPRFDAVLFDLDGTLLDSIELVLASFHHTFDTHEMARPTDAELLEGLGTPIEAVFARWSDERISIAAMIETYLAHNLAIHDSMVRPYPGVCELVHALCGDGARLGLVTSKRRASALRGLRAIGLEACFETLVCAGEAARAKPYPEPVHHALASLGVAPERAVFVGDSTHDMESGRAARVATAAVLWGPFSRAALEPTEPSVFAHDAAELRRYLYDEPEALAASAPRC
jgi:pyrophosphatase PpaX